VPLGIQQDLYVTVPKREYEAMEAGLQIDGRITAPVEAGKRFGTVQVTLKDKTLAEAPLIALEAVPIGGLWSGMVDGAWMWFE